MSKQIKNRFVEIAKSSMMFSELMENREQIQTADIIKKYPDGFTITNFDIAKMSDGQAFPVFLIGENDKIYYFGGTVLMKIVTAWIDDCGDLETAQDEIQACGGVKIKLVETKTKDGKKNLTTVEILG